MFLSHVVRGEGVKHYESVRNSKDGRSIDVSVTISPMRDAGGRIIGASTIVRDITARNRRGRLYTGVRNGSDPHSSILHYQCFCSTIRSKFLPSARAGLSKVAIQGKSCAGSRTGQLALTANAPAKCLRRIRLSG
jgi:hypothetical protein